MRGMLTKDFLKSTKFWVIAVASVIAAVGVAWGALFGLAYQLNATSPGKGSFIPTNKPVIFVRWAYTPGVRLKKAKVIFDGQDISSKVTKNPKSVYYRPPALPEGKHTVYADLTYSFIFKRKVRVKWHFTTDTIPPNVTFKGGAGDIVGITKKNIKLEGQTEPYAVLQATLNGKKIGMPKVGKSGIFYLKFASLQVKNELKLKETDRAGNQHNQVVTIIYDINPPKVVELSPPNGSTSHTENPQVVVKLEEKETAVREAKLIIDGTQVEVAYDPNTQALAYKPKAVFDGTHKAQVTAVDAAGNQVAQDWTFTVDTSRIIVIRSECRLYLYKAGVLKSTYPVAVGSSSYPTPGGHWKIASKRKNPTWNNPHVGWSANMPESIPPGPDNPLGQRALDLSVSGIRIHGTPSIGSVGHPVSHGCMRMYPWDIEVLFEQVSVGTPVDIQ